MNKSPVNKQMLSLGRLVGPTAVLTAALAALSLVGTSAAATTKPDSCPTNKQPVVNVSATIANAADYGADGHVWALDTGTHTIQIWRLGGNAYCVKVHDVGTSTTFSGASPEGTGTVEGGVIASFNGTIYARIYGTFAPKVATSGDLGAFDLRCGQDGTCAAPYPDPRDFYFSSVQNVDYGSFEFTADAGSCGTWHQSTSGDTGDIVC
jgi:hypothetical protein